MTPGIETAEERSFRPAKRKAEAKEGLLFGATSL
jgi:hypothetical protein